MFDESVENRKINGGPKLLDSEGRVLGNYTPKTCNQYQKAFNKQVEQAINQGGENA